MRQYGHHAGVAQPVEHQLPKLRVASSNLVARSNKIKGLGGNLKKLLFTV